MILEVKDLSFSYKDNAILENISLKLESPCTCSILGPNGIGKTTFIKCLLGLLANVKGDIFIDEKDVKRIDRKKFYNMVAYVKQGGKENSIYRVIDTILLGLASSINPLLKPKDTDIMKAYAIMKELNIFHLKDKYVSRLSGGEAQMVFIARALIKNPEILIMDEPESNLDYRNQILILDIIKTLEEKGKLIIFNTHYPDHALRYSKKTLMLSAGKKYLFGDTKDIITKENIEETFKIRAIVGELKDGDKVYKDIIPLSIT